LKTTELALLIMGFPYVKVIPDTFIHTFTWLCYVFAGLNFGNLIGHTFRHTV